MRDALFFLAGAAVGIWWGDLYRTPPDVMSPWERFTRALWKAGYRFRRPEHPND